MSDTSVVFSVVGRERGVSTVLAGVRKGFKSTGQQAEEAMKKAAQSTGRLDKEIEQVEAELQRLNAEFAETGNKELFAKIKRDKALLAQLGAVRKELVGTDQAVEKVAEDAKAMAGPLDDAADGFRLLAARAEIALRQASGSTSGLDREIGEVEARVRQLTAAFAATGDQEMFAQVKKDKALLTQLRAVRKELDDTDRSASRLSGAASEAASTGLASLTAGSRGLASGLAALPGPTWLLAAAVGALVGAFAAAGPAVYAFGGAVGALPGILVGAASVFGALKLGTSGLSSEYDRLTKKTGGGAGAARDMAAAHRAVESATRDVARAERELGDAQRTARQDQLAVNDARKQAKDDLDDMVRTLREASLDEEDAVAGVAQAQKELGEARAKGNIDDINEADRRYRRAQLTVETVRDRVKDLGEQQKTAAEKGVEGSDAVVAAKEREVQSLQRVQDAQERQLEATQRVADAQKALNAPQAGGGGGGSPITKLAPAAREFLNTILGLRPAFEALRLDVQQKLFAGLGDRVGALADRWMPTLHAALGGAATAFNNFFTRLTSTASQPTFIHNIGVAAAAANGALDRIGQAVAGPLTTAFGQLAAAAGPFMTRLGDRLAGIVEQFSAWIDQSDRTGKLEAFFSGAADVLDDIFDTLGSISGIAASVMSILFPSGSAGTGPLDSLAKVLKGIDGWLKDPEVRAQMQWWMDAFRAFGKDIADVAGMFGFLKPVAVGAFTAMMVPLAAVLGAVWLVVLAVKAVGAFFGWVADNAPLWWGKVQLAAAAAGDWIKDKWNALLDWFGGLPGRIGKSLGGMWDGVKDGFKAALNWVIGKWNNFHLNLPSVNWFGQTIGGGTIGTPDIPYLAKGGTAVEGGLAHVGEDGPEDVFLPRGASVVPLDRAGGGAPRRVIVDLRLNGRTIRELLIDEAKLTGTSPAALFAGTL